MCRDFLNVERVSLLAAHLAKNQPVAHVSGNAALKVGKAERPHAIAAIGRAEEREQGLVLIDGHQLPVAERPGLRREVEADELDLG